MSEARRGETLGSLQALMPTALANKMRESAGEIIGERREATVLFFDIADFTAAAQALGTEDIYLLTDEVMRLLAEVIYKYEGTIDKFTGDGLLALFGVPVAHENDPERAVRAGLEMQRVLSPIGERVRRRHAVNIQARIGINTGLVIAGPIGNDLHLEYTVIGDTVNLADRLQTAAGPGTVAVSFATYQRTRPIFRFRTLQPLRMKGRDDPVRAFQALGLRDEPDLVRGLPGLRIPMVGRRSALSQLEGVLAEVRKEGRSRVILLTGEAGVGKSRLVTEFRRSVVGTDVNFFEGSCMTYARSRPLWLLADVLRSIIGISEADPASLQREAVRAYLNALGMTDSTQHQVIAVLGLERSEPAGQDLPRNLDSAALRKLTYAALRRVFVAEAHQVPTVFVFDDLHWVDPASRDFLGQLIQSSTHMPVMMVLVSRDAELNTPVHPLVDAIKASSRSLAEVRLDPLSEAEGRELIDQLLGPGNGLVGALKNEIVVRAEGNPFYAEEIVRMLLDHGVVLREDDQLRVAPGARDLLDEIPGTIKSLILARLDQLPGRTRRTLQRAAVLGTSFPARLLWRLNGTAPDAMGAQLRLLEERQFLVPSPFGLERGYAFRHALVQQTVYSTLLKRDRQKIHQRAAEAIEGGDPGLQQERVEALAYHYSESHEPTRAVPYLICAAETAARRGATEITIQRLRQARSLMEASPADWGEQPARVSIGLGEALKLVGEYAEAKQLLEGAVQRLAHSSIDRESLDLLTLWIKGMRELADVRVREGRLDEAADHLEMGQSILGAEGSRNHPHLWRLLIDRLAWVRFRQGKLEEAFALASSATLNLDEKATDDPMTLASLYNTIGGVFWQWGNLSEAAGYVERSLELYRALNYAWGMANAYSNLGVLSHLQGRWLQASDYFERALELRRENGYLPEQADSLNNLGQLHIMMGEHDRAREELEASLAISQRLGNDRGIAYVQETLARLAVIQSRFDEAAARTQAALDLSGAAGERIVVMVRWLRALIQAERGDLAGGVESAQQALGAAEDAGLTEEVADCRRVLGILHGRTGDYREAETSLREAVHLGLQLDSPYAQAQALLELGLMYLRRSSAAGSSGSRWRDEALSVLHESAELFERLGAAHDLSRARAALSQFEADVKAKTVSGESPSREAGAAMPMRDAELPEGEWHNAVILSLNLVPPPDADEEALFETLSMIIPSLKAIAAEYGGKTLRQQDGLTMVFGAPAAYEDDAERAIKTAQRIVEHLESPAGLAVSLGFSVGIARGDIVAGHLQSRFHTEFVVEGKPIHVAERVADAAPQGCILVTGPVRAATERLFAYEPAPAAVELAHRRLWQLSGVRDRPRAARGVPGLEARLVGRKSSLRAMGELAEGLSRGIGGLIWIEGEAGIGKSRLMREFVASVKSNDVRISWGSCSAQRSDHVFSAFSDLLVGMVGVHPDNAPDQMRAQIDRTFRSWPQGARMAQPYVELLLGVQPSGSPGERLARLAPDQLRQQTFVAMRRLLKVLADEKPLVILLDDLHWIDAMSAELLQFLVNLVVSAPVLFVCAQRRQGADAPNDRLARVQGLIPSQTVRLRLGRLSEAESKLLLAELLPEAQLPETLHSVILERSAGNPYFIEEFIRMLIEQGCLARRGDGWDVSPDLACRDLPVPSSLEALIHSRVDTLPPELKQLMRYASVVGDPVEASVLEWVSGLSKVTHHLNRLASRLLVRQDGETGRWRFAHSMIECVIYSSMLQAKRTAMHREVAYALEARWEGTEADHAETLAYHFAQADEGAKALSYLILAGERAAARSANEQAVCYFEQAAQRLSGGLESSLDLRWRVFTGLGDAYRSVGRYQDSRGALVDGLALLETGQLSDGDAAGLHRRLGETGRKQGAMDVAEEHFQTALALLGEPADDEVRVEAARVLTGAAWVYFLRGQFHEARRVCEAARDHAEQTDAVIELAAVENLLGGICYRQGEWTPALHHTMRAMTLREQIGYTWGAASSLSNLGVLAVSAGHWDRARSFFERSLKLRQEMGDVEGMVILHNNLGTLARQQGKLDEAESHYTESLALARPFEIGFHIGNSAVGLARVLLLRGECEAAREVLATAFSHAEATGAQDLLAEACQVRARLLLDRSAWGEAKAEAERSAALAAESGNLGLETAAWRLASQVELERSDLEAALGELTKARHALTHVTDQLENGRVAALAGRIALAQGQVAKAQAELGEAKAIFMRLGATRDLAEVRWALERRAETRVMVA
jgi:predicted ATPase/class 3 adenylate cyclase/Tfp pilus assembly protein PilF